MKISSKIRALLLAIVSCVLGLNATSWAQQSVSVTPSVISNTYTGVITLQIIGLTNGETVSVFTYLDLNSNGVVDPGEILIDAFKITESGTNALFGGVTNVNIPMDQNPATNIITTMLSVAPPLTLANTVGQQIFQVVSPTGRFSPVTTTLKVTNAVTAQTVAGTVLSGGSPLPHAVVVALFLPNTDYAGAAVADASGHYSLNLTPGTYALIPAFPNYYTDQSLAPQITLTNAGTASNNLILTNGLVANTISGKVYDAASSNGIPGVFLQLQSGNLFGIAFADPNGNYSTASAPGFWKIKPGKERLPRTGYVVSQNTFQVNATAGTVSNANLALYKANALFYGRITDNLNAPLTNIIFDAEDNANQFNGKGYSDSNGNYTVGILATTNDNWFCNANGSDQLSSYILNNFNPASVTNGQVIRQDFVALPITGHIAGHVLDNHGNPVVGVDIFANTFDGSYQSQNVNTDNSGNYSLGVATGSWVVGLSDQGEGGLNTAGFADLTGPHTVSIPPTNATLNITVYPLDTPAISQPQRISSSQFGFNVTGAVGVTYTLQSTTNLASTNWSSLFSFQLTNNPFPLVDLHATNSPRYYRIQKGP